MNDRGAQETSFAKSRSPTSSEGRYRPNADSQLMSRMLRLQLAKRPFAA